MYMALAFLLLLPVTAYSQPTSKATKLQCKGTYDDFQVENARNIQVQGIYIEIGSNIQISGSPGFDATYLVTTRKKDGVDFQLPDNPSVVGYINRYSGELSLMVKGAPAPDGGVKIKRMVSVTCAKAEPMF